MYPSVQRSFSFTSKEVVFDPSLRNAIALDYLSVVRRCLRIRGTSLQRILVLAVSSVVFALLVVFANRVLQLPIYMEDRMITMMGSAIAMLLAFRTNRSFERYNQAAQTWTTLTIQLRQVGRLLWSCTSSNLPYDERRYAMKLLLAAALSTKQALRGECHQANAIKELGKLMSKSEPLSPIYEDSISDIKKHHRTCTTTSLSPAGVTALPPPTQRTISQDSYTSSGSTYMNARNSGSATNNSLDILHRLRSHIRPMRDSSYLGSEDYSGISSCISSAMDAVTRFEQIMYIPVPQTYDIHIKQVLLLYFIALPFQLVKTMGWTTPIVAFIMSLSFFGTDSIASEISEPFRTEDGGIPLDLFCKRLRHDLEYVIGGSFDEEEDDDGRSSVITISDDGKVYSPTSPSTPYMASKATSSAHLFSGFYFFSWNSNPFMKEKLN